MERDLLLAALIAEVLGPRGGPLESLKREEDPREEYITGVLVPHRAASVSPDAEVDLQAPATTGADDEADPGEGVQSPVGAVADHLVCPALDPRAPPSSLGVSFSLSHASGKPSVDVCCTWARYSSNADGGWQRSLAVSSGRTLRWPGTHRSNPHPRIRESRSRFDPGLRGTTGGFPCSL